MSAKPHLSIVELLIIVVLLGVMARTVAPRFAGAGDVAKISQLIGRLEEMRAALDLYKVQHENTLPPTSSFAVFEIAMTKRVGVYGPYIKEIPTNPFNNLKIVRFDGEPAGCGEAGWRLDTQSGLFQADSDAGHAAL